MTSEARYPGLSALASAEGLETGRLILRQFRESDLDLLADIQADPIGMQFIGPGKVLDRIESWRSIAAMLGHWVLRGYGMWAVELKPERVLIGRAGFYNPEGWPGFEIGWHFSREYWGRGYATEAASAALNYAWDTLHEPRAYSVIRHENAASVRVAERIGSRYLRDIEVSGGPALLYAVDNPKSAASGSG